MKLGRVLKSFWINLKRLFRAGNHDFCPGVNRYVYWLKRPIGWLLTAAFASLLVGVALEGPQGWIVLSVVSLVILLGVLWPAIQMWACQGQMLVEQPRGVEGQTLRITLRIVNRLPFPLWGLMIGQRFLQDVDAQPPQPDRDSEADPAMATLARVPGWSVTDFHWDHRPAVRGRFPQSGTRIATGFPFGIWQSSRWLNFDRTCLIWPRVPPLTDGIMIDHLRLSGEQAFEERAGEEGDFFGLRSYRPGDSLRKIHWPQSARSGALIVRESEKAVSRQVTLVVDVSDLLARLPDMDAVSKVSVNGGGSVGPQPARWAAPPDATVHASAVSAEVLAGNRASTIPSRSPGTVRFRLPRELEQRAETRLRVALSVVEALWIQRFDVRVQIGYQVWETSGVGTSVRAWMDQLALWSWTEFFERWAQQRSVNLRPDFAVGQWAAWQQTATAVHSMEPQHGLILVDDDYDYHSAELRLKPCPSPRGPLPCWRTVSDPLDPVGDAPNLAAGWPAGESNAGALRRDARKPAGKGSS